MEYSLFSDNNDLPSWIELPNSQLLYISDFLTPQQADTAFSNLRKELDWQQEAIQMFGRKVLQPRLQAWHGDKSYTYSGLSLTPEPWSPELLHIKQRCEAASRCQFNSVLANLYRDGQDSMGWHQDNEPELGVNPAIASLSLGESRRFILRHIETRQKYEIELSHGSLLVMAGETQRYWQHSVPKTGKPKTERINLTFRHII